MLIGLLFRLTISLGIRKTTSYYQSNSYWFSVSYQTIKHETYIHICTYINISKLGILFAQYAL